MATQHPEQAVINDLQHIRIVAAWARLGVLAADVLINQAQEKLDRRIEAGTLTAEEAVKCRDLLQNLRSRVMPSEQRCAQAVAEVDRVLMPLRNVIRSREGYTPRPADRVLVVHAELADEPERDRPRGG